MNEETKKTKTQKLGKGVWSLAKVVIGFGTYLTVLTWIGRFAIHTVESGNMSLGAGMAYGFALTAILHFWLLVLTLD